jgi:hypothetical protein
MNAIEEHDWIAAILGNMALYLFMNGRTRTADALMDAMMVLAVEQGSNTTNASVSPKVSAPTCIDNVIRFSVVSSKKSHRSLYVVPE